jgi:hypothetical protein
VDRTVAEQEEAIKRVRVVQEAERTREALIITAEAEAQEALVKDIKAAEAAEASAQFRAREQLVLAEADQKSADLDATSAVRRAEGARATAGAEGLAAAEVSERQALADAVGIRARLEAESEGLMQKARGIEKVGMAEAAVAESKALANAAGIERVGMAEAAVAQSKALANAAGIEKAGMAEAAVAESRALADAAGIRERLLGEAAGLKEKATAMAALDEASRTHEEYRLRLGAEKEIRLAALDVQRQVAEAQASVLAAGLQGADIDIVGGDSVFLERLVGAVSFGKGIDGAVQNSDTLKALGAEWLSGEKSFTADATEILTALGKGGPLNLLALQKLLNDGAETATGPALNGIVK